ncbi:ankyrin repeat domain-containing protein 49 [Oncorhynchus keta]|uniref:ankyrin repeat domain-containing protein 49 n=1 Tax=Oncorhynchus keta TaxID=8018 RepID=UPI0015F8C980|nr:ankyrin repeat domain-containing protein 49 [Oncorhynchus keta]XP_035645060.1 ankyrin repeat domain-containing protein 49 [Oncorhynchus keta]XP_035645061.1 ankyrin repeat domain-containing protein 49 [Oncorhynchus keta]XP_035645062.1 ankyrin repeat domain-containing protein 49 [Oncorhynchus keta]XP_035645063.1 ankyrin repeat domain-containing protein 49 [Oncorhynchus keta]XP_035645065.1 ankyrin repeat domain-containing protein 49 [Oncorhynchus keta]
MEEFPESFNQLELLKTHDHLIPRGACSLWPGDEGEEEEEEGERSEEWYQQKEEKLKDRPEELMLWAAENNRLPTVKRLLSVDPLLAHCQDEDGYTPLHRAAYGGHAATASTLLAAGTEVNSRTADGWTPLHSACRWGQVATASLLLRQGAELNAQTNGGLTALHLAASHPGPGSAHTLEFLLSQRHIKAELQSNSRETASEIARRSGPHHFLFEMVEDCNSVRSPR